jgi:ABC-type Mn2+/Zn2+ transport system permease subunit
MDGLADALFDPFRTGIGQRALAEMLLIAVVCGPLGVWTLLYRRSYTAESISHAALPGLVLAALAGVSLTLGAAAGLAAAVVLIALAARLRTIDADVSVAVAITFLFGLGTLLALAASTPPRLGELLFGDPLGVSTGDLSATAALVVAAVGALAALHRPLTLVGFDRQGAPSLGARPDRVEGALLVLLALTILIAIQALGNLLVVAVLIAPAAAGLRLGRSLRGALAWAVLAGALSGIAGLYASYYLDTAAGASIALGAIAVFGLSLARRPGRGDHARGVTTGSPVQALGGTG